MQLTTIQNKIYEVRGLSVMLDFDLAELYEVETKRLNEAVKRNIERFPKVHVSSNKNRMGSYAVANCDRIRSKQKKYFHYTFCFHRTWRDDACQRFTK